LSHLTCKTLFQITYTVLVETLNPCQSIKATHYDTLEHCYVFVWLL